MDGVGSVHRISLETGPGYMLGYTLVIQKTINWVHPRIFLAIPRVHVEKTALELEVVSTQIYSTLI